MPRTLTRAAITTEIWRQYSVFPDAQKRNLWAPGPSNVHSPVCYRDFEPFCVVHESVALVLSSLYTNTRLDALRNAWHQHIGMPRVQIRTREAEIRKNITIELNFLKSLSWKNMKVSRQVASAKVGRHFYFGRRLEATCTWKENESGSGHQKERTDSNIKEISTNVFHKLKFHNVFHKRKLKDSH